MGGVGSDPNAPIRQRPPNFSVSRYLLARTCKRKPISKKLRFEIFKRDGFTCSYCGRTPPAVTLQVDHILAVSKGGSSEPENLCTSCHECNIGKSNRPLDSIPNPLSVTAEQIAERELQIKEYAKLLKSIDRRKEKAAQKVSLILAERFKKWELSRGFIEGTLKSRFMDKLTQQEIQTAMHIACSRMTDVDNAIRYFCGICWKRIRGEDGK